MLDGGCYATLVAFFFWLGVHVSQKDGHNLRLQLLFVFINSLRKIQLGMH